WRYIQGDMECHSVKQRTIMLFVPFLQLTIGQLPDIGKHALVFAVWVFTSPVCPAVRRIICRGNKVDGKLIDSIKLQLSVPLGITQGLYFSSFVLDTNFCGIF